MGNIIWDVRIAFILILGATIGESSLKKGVCVNPRAFLCDDFKALTNIAWWYDWGANLDKIIEYSGCVNVTENAESHVPMAWGYGKYFSNYYIYDHAKFLLGFNEPNHKKQSNIKPEDAARYWSEVEALAGERKIVSPAAAPCGSSCNGNMTEWFDAFFKHCNNCRVDYLATHLYYCNADKTMGILKDLYDRYKLQIWLTEFACPYTKNPQKELRYMMEILPRLEAAPYIFRYAWYESRVNQSQANDFISTAVNLLELDSSSLTTLGQFYISFNGTETTPTTTTETTPTTTTETVPSATTTSGMTSTTITTRKESTTTTSGSLENTTTFTPFSTTRFTTKFSGNGIFTSDARRAESFADSILILTAWLVTHFGHYL